MDDGRSPRGATLTELIVSIAIILVLAVLVMRVGWWVHYKFSNPVRHQGWNHHVADPDTQLYQSLLKHDGYEQGDSFSEWVQAHKRRDERRKQKERERSNKQSVNGC